MLTGVVRGGGQMQKNRRNINEDSSRVPSDDDSDESDKGLAAEGRSPTSPTLLEVPALRPTRR